MRDALADAQVQPEQIDYVNAHASSTQLNDSAETMSIKEVLVNAPKKIPVSGHEGLSPRASTRRYGRDRGRALRAGVRSTMVPPTINYQNPDPACDLDVVPNHGRAAELIT